MSPHLCLPLRAAIGGLAVASGLLFAMPARAALISGTYSLPSCTSGGSTVKDCIDTAFISDQTVTATAPFIDNGFPAGSPATASFTTAFDNWNAANGNLWTLVDGGTLNIGISVNTISVGMGQGGAGIHPIILTLSNYTPGTGDPALDQLVWTQALYTNYTPSVAGLATPMNTLDTASLSSGSSNSGTAFTTACEAIPGQAPGPNNTTPAVIGAVASGSAYCDPIYPFQYGQTTSYGPDFFYDAPSGPWPDAAFRGTTLLSTVTFVTDATGAITSRVLTTYQGVTYGFNLQVPEPSSLWLVAPPLVLLVSLRRRDVASRARTRYLPG